MNRQRRTRQRVGRRRRGMVLVLVLVVIALLTLACLTFSKLMLNERRAAQLSARQAQARVLADSGVEMTRLFVLLAKETQDEYGGWYNNPDQFRMQLVVDDEEDRDPGRFSIVAPDQIDGIYEGIRFGLEDESTRMNLNILAALDKDYPGSGREILMGLPGMTEERADAILDWIDEDDEPREFGAELEYYSGLQPAYAPKNGPLETVEELLLVRDVTPWLLFGVDGNRNGLLDSGEPDPMNIDPEVDNSDGSMNRGWAAYLTLYSLELNLDPDGEPKIDLNKDNLEELYEELEEAMGTEAATFVVAFRQNGPYSGSELGVKVLSGELDLEKEGSSKFTTVLDLIGTNVQVTFEGDNRPTVMETPFPNLPTAMNLYLPILMDNVAVNTSPVIPGRININQAPRTVLAGIPDLSEEALDQIIAEREPDPTQREPYQRHETWILGDGHVTLEEMKKLMPFVTGGGSVFRAQVIGYFDRGGPTVRIETLLDATSQPVEMIFFRDLTHLGRGYALGTLGIEDLFAQPSGGIAQ